MKKRIAIASIAASVMAVFLLPVGALAHGGGPKPSSSTVIYDATPSPVPANVASLGYQATSTSEFGDFVRLGGTDRDLKSVTVTMSNWALYSEYASDARYNGNNKTWTHPITVNIYDTPVDSNGVPTTLLATKTQSVTIPWRPAADPTCATPTAYKAADGQCYNGIAFNATFDLSSLDVMLPDDVIVSFAYNTANYGKTPLGAAGPYNSLNVGIPNNQVASVGSDQDADKVFWDTTYPGYTAGLREDTAWAPNGTVSMRIDATKPTENECKSDGWKKFRGRKFKHQRECEDYCKHGRRDNDDRDKKDWRKHDLKRKHGRMSRW